MAKNCGKRRQESWCAGSSPASGLAALPIIEVTINGRRVRALVDSGCSRTVVREGLCKVQGPSCDVTAVDGSRVVCEGRSDAVINVRGVSVKVWCVVTKKLLSAVDAVLGMDVIAEMGGVMIMDGARVEFGKRLCSVGCISASNEKHLVIKDKDFSAEFDGKDWYVGWVWKDSPAELANTVECYRSVKSPEAEMAFDEEIQRWITEGWLKPWTGSVGGVLPLMAVIQKNKGKVRPVMDYRELNESVQCHTGEDAAVCDETLRKWRQMGRSVKLLDLQSAYLQVRVHRDLWRYQLVRYRGRTYCLTRLGFGLKCGPKIMSRIVNEVLSLDEKVRQGTDSYIDDIIVNEAVVSAEEVGAHLRAHGLIAKPPEELEGAKVLGLHVQRNTNGSLIFKRGNQIPTLQERITKRELFSICGKLTGHYPVCGWLRVACSFLKRESEGQKWDDYIGDRPQQMAEDLVVRVRIDDPVRGVWSVPNVACGAKVYCDASSLALGVTLEVEGKTVEDAAWMRKASDVSHINLAELDAVMKGVNLALKWNVKTLEVVTDSATVLCWVRSTLTGSNRVRVTGMSEMLVKRRLGLLKDVVEECGLTLKISFVESCKNKADVLTRVCKTWTKRTLKEYSNMEDMKTVCAVSLQEMHAQHHFGVDRTLHLAKLVDPAVTRGEVERCVRSCMECRTIDPSPSSHEAGILSVPKLWSRLAIDVTHFNRRCFLTIIDCGPSRFAIWREIRSESAALVVEHLEEIFRERGPPDELLMDNGTAFRSYSVAELCNRWNVRRRFRAAYRPAGNGIVERHHRTIKSTAARSGGNPLQAVFWYNLAARSQDDPSSAPSSLINNYAWRHPSARHDHVEERLSDEFQIGDVVAVKPTDGRCTSRWRPGRVTAVISVNNIEVDGVPRHVLDLRRLPRVESTEARKTQNVFNLVSTPNLLDLFEEDAEESVADEAEEERGSEEAADSEGETGDRPARTRRPPVWLKDYVE